MTGGRPLFTSIIQAPAKVNLYLHVGPPRPDGYHHLSSLVLFASVGDTVTIRPSTQFEFFADGPFAADLGPTSENLVVRAAEGMASAFGRDLPSVSVTLTKNLPVASGLGGGSADAAAAMKGFVSEFPYDDGATARAVLARLGSDCLVCFDGRPTIAEGRGDQLSKGPRLPQLGGILVNPMISCPTPAVFAEYDRMGRFGGTERGAIRPGYQWTNDFLADLSACRNDLEAPAIALHPEIAEVRAELEAAPEVALARLSGSGATMFGLCRSGENARALADRIRARHPDWWCVTSGFGGRPV